MSAARELPIVQAIKVTNKSFVAGHPSQIVDLLTSGVATAIVRSKPNSNSPFYECLLRCPLLAPNSNLPVYFCLDHLNQPIAIKEKVAFLSIGETLAAGTMDEERARAWNASMILALSFWEVKMEELVHSLYPNRTAKQVGSYADSATIEMKIWPSLTNVEALLDSCARRGGFPSFKLSFTWVGSKEDPRSKDHIWGMKFDFSSYGTFPAVPRTRKPVSASEKQEILLRKRKVDLEIAETSEEVLEANVASDNV